MLKIVIALFLFLVILVLLESYREMKRFKITEYRIAVPHLRKGERLKFVVAADLHNKEYGKQNAELLGAIDKEQPDGLLIAGDIVVAVPGADQTVAVEFVKAAAVKYPVYYGYGNHEQRLKLYPETYGKCYEEYKLEMDKCNVSMLANEKRDYQDKPIRIYGLEMNKRYYQRLRRKPMDISYLTELLGQPDPDYYNILLAHNPDYFCEYAGWGADLVLSGHVHGGVVRLPLLGGVVSTQFRLFPKYSGGHYHEGSSQMLLSRGLGTHTINFRLFNQPELIVVCLEGEKE